MHAKAAAPCIDHVQRNACQPSFGRIVANLCWSFSKASMHARSQLLQFAGNCPAKLTFIQRRGRLVAKAGVNMRRTWSSVAVGFAVAATLAATAWTGTAVAQVAYQPYTAPTPYGYPVPGGFLQPDEVLGTSPSFVISPNPYLPTVSVVQTCQYPDGWNITDLSRDLNGIPGGLEHTCPAPVVARRRVHARY